AIIIRRRFQRSAAAPATSEKRAAGTSPTKPTRPAFAGECVRAKTSSGNASAVAWEPTAESNWPVSRRTKSRFRQRGGAGRVGGGRVRAETEFGRVESYPEYPGTEHPMRILQRVLVDMGLSGPVGADQDGYPGILGYEGPSLSEVTGNRVALLAPFIEGILVR